MVEKYCLFCNEKLLGRTDKKFCDDHCRSIYNNQLNAQSNANMRKVDYTLKKNRRILMALFNQGNQVSELVIDKKILESGFQFHFHTHIDILESGETCFYCYEYGIIPKGNFIKVIRALA
jgi:predicted nucleic acid-binding Zn ribbon protein